MKKPILSSFFALGKVMAVSAGALLLSLTACTSQQGDNSQQSIEPTLSEAETFARSSGIYAAYPGPQQEVLTPAPEGYEAFYISHYNRHGSRYQPNNDRYQHTLDRLLQAQAQDRLTAHGESLILRIQQLCDSCLGHGGQLTTVGAQQLYGIGQRVAERFPEVFGRTSGTDGARPRLIRSRASVVPRCGASAQAFMSGFASVIEPKNLDYSNDSVHMAYIAYDTPLMRQLSSREADWQPAYDHYKHTNVDCTRIIESIFTDATGVDTLQTVIDLYWLIVGMQNVDVPGCDLSDVFTPDELLHSWQCVNYRMYVCNALCPQSRGIPAASASTLLQNIIESADQAIETDTVAADFRFGHDSNLLRLLALMRVDGATAEVEHTSEAWQHWQEYKLTPMGGNLQMIFYRDANAQSNATGGSSTDNASTHTKPILVKLLHNEAEVLLDAPIKPVTDCYYAWPELRAFLTSQLVTDDDHDDVVTVHIQ